MDQPFISTTAILEKWDACRDGINLFLSAFKDGEATIMEALDACATRKHPKEAEWLLNALTRNQIPLPAALASVAGRLYLRGYQHPLPAALASVAESTVSPES